MLLTCTQNRSTAHNNLAEVYLNMQNFGRAEPLWSLGGDHALEYNRHTKQEHTYRKDIERKLEQNKTEQALIQILIARIARRLYMRCPHLHIPHTRGIDTCKDGLTVAPALFLGGQPPTCNFPL
jgi:hypothetical protein